MLPDLVGMVFHTFPVDGVESVPVNATQVINNKRSQTTMLSFQPENCRNAI